jgi:hypothetical protein
MCGTCAHASVRFCRLACNTCSTNSAILIGTTAVYASSRLLQYFIANVAGRLHPFRSHEYLLLQVYSNHAQHGYLASCWLVTYLQRCTLCATHCVVLTCCHLTHPQTHAFIQQQGLQLRFVGSMSQLVQSVPCTTCSPQPEDGMDGITL